VREEVGVAQEADEAAEDQQRRDVLPEGMKRGSTTWKKTRKRARR
jgi:hypothetical protein